MIGFEPGSSSVGIDYSTLSTGSKTTSQGISCVGAVESKKLIKLIEHDSSFRKMFSRVMPRDQ